MKSTKALFLTTVLIFLAGTAAVFAEDSENSDKTEDSASVKNAALSVGLAFTVNVFFNSADRIILEEDFAAVNLQTIKRNLTHAWWWDVDGFATNQFGHPYQGSLYFNAGRANGLNFWQSLAVAAFGSFTWEEFGETDAPSINDIITTPICGAVFGEVFHRLYIDADALCPALAWILSPLDGFSSLTGGKRAKVSGRIEEIDLLFHGGLECSKVDFSGSTDSDKLKKGAGGSSIRVQYGEKVAHDSKEPFDLFTLDLDSAFSLNFYRADFCIDGFLWSRAVYFEKSAGTFGVNLIYEGEWASNAVFSNAATGLKYFHETEFSGSDGRFSFYAQIDGIFMGTRSIYSLYKNRSDYADWETPPRFYDFGCGFLSKLGFSLGTKRLGTLFAEAGASALLPFLGSQFGQTKCEKNLMALARLGYERGITERFSLVLRGTFTCKADRYKKEPDTTQIFSSAEIFGKFAFTR